MLSRVAERIYWSARYLQRAESMARLVNVYTNLLMDLPRDVGIGWFNLITLNNAENEYDSRYKVRDERNVVKFNLADDTNANSLKVCIDNVRENMRTTRDVLPDNTWELINELTAFVNQSISGAGLNRDQRHEFLISVINQCQMIQGFVASTVAHDEVWAIWCLGRDLERADMTTRILDAGANLLKSKEYAEDSQLPIVVWGNVLRSSSAHHAYRKKVSASVNGKKVAQYLVFDNTFPRAVHYCMDAISHSVKSLPRGRKVMAVINAEGLMITKKKSFNDLGEDFSAYLNELQLNLGSLNKLFTDTWFSLD